MRQFLNLQVGKCLLISTNLANSSDLRSAPSPSIVQTDALLDTYFSRFHARPFYILDESTVRQRLQLNQLPKYLVNAIYAVAARYVPQSLVYLLATNINIRYTLHPNGYQAAVKLSEEYASRARLELDIDEPSIDALQACLLLVIAFIAAGKGKKAYMLFSKPDPPPLFFFSPPWKPPHNEVSH